MLLTTIFVFKYKFLFFFCLLLLFFSLFVFNMKANIKCTDKKLKALTYL